MSNVECTIWYVPQQSKIPQGTMQRHLKTASHKKVWKGFWFKSGKRKWIGKEDLKDGFSRFVTKK